MVQYILPERIALIIHDTPKRSATMPNLGLDLYCFSFSEIGGSLRTHPFDTKNHIVAKKSARRPSV
jgi:hypothetical protein